MELVSGRLGASLHAPRRDAPHAGVGVRAADHDLPGLYAEATGARDAVAVRGLRDLPRRRPWPVVSRSWPPTAPRCRRRAAVQPCSWIPTTKPAPADALASVVTDEELRRTDASVPLEPGVALQLGSRRQGDRRRHRQAHSGLAPSKVAPVFSAAGIRRVSTAAAHEIAIALRSRAVLPPPAAGTQTAARSRE